MESLLVYVIIVLSAAIFALGGFWFYHEGEAHRRRVSPPQLGRRAGGHDRWEGAVRPSRGNI
jgi:hypothetical protein